MEEHLEAQLASVIERDGVLLSTPHGLRKRALKRVTVTQMAQGTAQQPVEMDEIADFDKVLCSAPVFAQEQTIRQEKRQNSTSIQAQLVGTSVRQVPLRREKHERSPFVVSLRQVSFAQADAEQEERISLEEITDSLPQMSALPEETYATMSVDLRVSSTEVFDFDDQFTPADAELAYQAVYGRFDRVSALMREGWEAFTSVFQKAERFEQAAVEQVREEVGMYTEVRQFSFARAVAAFAGLALVVMAPAQALSVYRNATDRQAVIERAGSEAVASVMEATKGGSIADSADALKQASARFREADAALSQAGGLAVGLASFLPNQYRTARALLEVGDKSSEAGRLLALGIDKVFSDPGRRMDERLDVLATYARSSLALLGDARKAATTVDPAVLPEAQREKVTKLLAKLDTSGEAMREFVQLSELMSNLVGKKSLKKYLFIFQNNSELRPTGGFMGSLAEVTFDQGEIQSIRVPEGGPYDLKGSLLANIVSPEPLHLINTRWQFQDANWSPDFPTAADKIKWFWSKSGQSSVDGVITVNASLMLRILEVTGPIPMPAYGKTIDASNFMLETQKSVEVEYDKQANTPKKFIGDLMAALLERVKTFTKDDWMKVLALGSDALETKDIQVAFSDPEAEALAERFGWNGRMKETAGDALAIVEANIAGQKTDVVINEKVQHEAKIAMDGSIVDAVTLEREHTGKKGEIFRGVRNVSYVRFYVPKGSQLVTATGFEKPEEKLFKVPEPTDTPDPQIQAVESKKVVQLDQIDVMTEGDRTVFGGWLQLDPGKTQTVTLSYRLPFTVADLLPRMDIAQPQGETLVSRDAYFFLMTSQSGRPRTVEHRVTYPVAWKPIWKRQLDEVGTGQLGYSGSWDRDIVTATLFDTSSHVQSAK